MFNYSINKTQSSHYEKFKPITNKAVETHSMINNKGFTPLVWAQSATKKTPKDIGYREQNNIVGLLPGGYIDVDYPKHIEKKLKDGEDVTADIAALPSIKDISLLLQPAGIELSLYPSASRKDKKCRIIYNRNITLYNPKYFNPETNTWDLSLKHGDILPRMDKTHILYSDGTVEQLPTTLGDTILSLLSLEMEHITQIVSTKYPIFAEMVDKTSLALYMHSKHLTNTGDKIPEPVTVEGKPLEVWNA